MMDWLYDELAPAQKRPFDEHVEICAQCKAELASLMQTREAFSQLPAEDPPASISAILLHEAAKHAPKPAPSEQRLGFWAWLSALFSPIVTHPAAAAVATLVLVAGVAGTFYLRGDEQYAKPTAKAGESARSTALAKSADLRGSETDGDKQREQRADNDGRDVAAAPTPDRAEPEAANELGEAQANQDTSFQADLLSDEDSEKLGLRPAEQSPADSPAKQPPPGLNNERASRDRSSRGKQADKKSLDPAPVATGESSTDGLIADDELDAEEFGQESVKAEAEVTGVRGGTALEQAPSAKRANRPARKAAPKKPRSTTANKGKKSASRGRSAPTTARAPAGAPASVDAADVGKVTARSGKDKDSKSAWAKRQEQRLITALRAKRCGEVARIANDIRDRDPVYYRNNIARSRSIKPCVSLIAKEQTRRAARRKASKARKADAAEAEAEAADRAVEAE